MSFCADCGFKKETVDNFCQSCGAPQHIAAVTSDSVLGKTSHLMPDAVPNYGSTATSQPEFLKELTSVKESVLTELGKRLMNPVFFVIMYIVTMVPTYLLPYVGSNSSVINGLGAAMGIGFNPAFWFHAGALAILILITWLRGQLIRKSWLISLPIAASLFDMLPGLSMIPMVPTMLHVVTIISGAKEDADK